jgi:hypothetical protein
LNPFAKEPQSFAEGNFVDRTHRLDTLLMPHLTNMICVTNLSLPQAGDQKTKEEVAVAINALFQYPQSNISAIYVSEPGAAFMSCFIKFHHYTYMVEFIEKHGA